MPVDGGDDFGVVGAPGDDVDYFARGACGDLAFAEEAGRRGARAAVGVDRAAAGRENCQPEV